MSFRLLVRMLSWAQAVDSGETEDENLGPYVEPDAMTVEISTEWEVKMHLKKAASLEKQGNLAGALHEVEGAIRKAKEPKLVDFAQDYGKELRNRMDGQA